MHHIAADPTLQRDMAGILETARYLQCSAESGTTRPLLRGHRFGLMQGEASRVESDAFAQAVVGLGGQISQLRIDLAELEDPREAQRTAKLLGRLYSAVICESVDPSIVMRLRRDCDVPIFADVTSSVHIVAQATALLDHPLETPWFALQALLVRSLR